MVKFDERPTLSLEDYDELEGLLFDEGYLSISYNPERITKITHIPCPICGRSIITEQCGNSYGIRCEDEDCLLVTVRGI